MAATRVSLSMDESVLERARHHSAVRKVSISKLFVSMVRRQMKKQVKSVCRRRRVFLDTNVILDFFLGREPFYDDALKLWAACEEGRVEGYVSALTVNNVHYVAERMKGETAAMIAVVPPSSFVL